MAKKEKRSRKRPPGKRVTEQVGRVGVLVDDDPDRRQRAIEDRRRALAIDAAVYFLLSAVAQERIALARRPGAKPGPMHTENVIARGLAALPTVDAVRESLAADPDRVPALEHGLDADVGRMARAFVDRLPKEFLAARKEREFIDSFKSAEGWEKIPFALDDSEGWARLEKARAELDDVLEERDRRRMEIGKENPELALKIDANAISAIAHPGQSVFEIDDPKWRAIEDRIAEKVNAVDELDPRTRVFSSMTAVRQALTDKTDHEKEAIEESVRLLTVEIADLETKIATLRESIPGPNIAEKRRLETKVAKKQKELKRLVPKWDGRTFGSRVTVIDLAKRTGIRSQKR